MKQQKKDYKYPINNMQEDVLDCDMSPNYTIYADFKASTDRALNDLLN